MEFGETPVLIAARLGFPCLSQVREITPGPIGLRVEWKTDRGIASCRLVSPCVYALGEAKHSYLRMPTLRERLAAGNRRVETLAQPADPGLDNEASFVKAWCEDSEQACEWVEGATVAEKARIVWERYLRGRKK
jgi:electron transfer flavoprotein alpha/beta subunit